MILGEHDLRVARPAIRRQVAGAADISMQMRFSGPSGKACRELSGQIITPMGFLGVLGTNVGTATLVDAPFDWRTGLRVGMGVQRCDGFDLNLYYTNFFTSATSQAAGEVYSAFMGNFYIDNVDGGDYGPYYRHASIQWDFNFNSIDFEISRSFAVGATWSCGRSWD